MLYRSYVGERKKSREKKRDIQKRRERTELSRRKRMKKYDFSYGNHLSNLHTVACIWQKNKTDGMDKPQLLALLIVYPTRSIEIIVLHNAHSYRDMYICQCIFFHFRLDRFNILY